MPDTNHPYGATGQPAHRRPSYSSLTEAERWQWHAELYAFRRVVLEASRDEQTSPCDPDGAWFVASFVDAAERALRAKLTAARERRDRVRAEDDRRGGRALLNAWAKAQGCADLDDYAARERIDWIDAYKRALPEIVGQASEARLRQWGGGRRQRAMTLAEIQAGLGLTATAREFSPTPEQLAEGRRQLGLEPGEENSDQ